MRVDWIPVTEGLPDGCDDVLITVQIPDEGDDMFVLVGWWNAIFKSWAVYDEPGSKMEHNVIAWASLPEPYLGDVKDERDAQIVKPESCFKVWAPLPAPREGGKKKC